MRLLISCPLGVRVRIPALSKFFLSGKKNVIAIHVRARVFGVWRSSNNVHQLIWQDTHGQRERSRPHRALWWTVPTFFVWRLVAVLKKLQKMFCMTHFFCLCSVFGIFCCGVVITSALWSAYTKFTQLNWDFGFFFASFFIEVGIHGSNAFRSRTSLVDRSPLIRTICEHG